MAELIDWNELTLDVNGRRLIAPCFTFKCYTWSSDGLLQFYERAREALGPALTHYRAEDMEWPKKLTDRAETIVPTWFRRMSPVKTYQIEFAGCATEQGVTSARLEMFFYETPPFARSEEARAERRAAYEKLLAEWGTVPPIFVMEAEVMFPPDHELAEPARALEWILDLDLVKTHPFLSGYAGYGLNVDHTVGNRAARVAMLEKLASLLLRHPGLDWYRAGAQYEYVLRYDAARSDFVPLVKRANWLNLVSDVTLEYLGGREGVRRELSDDAEIVVRDLAHGVAIQAGPEPRLGDVARRDFLPAYRRVAKVLRPMRAESFEGVGSAFGDDQANEWLEALDREYD